MREYLIFKCEVYGEVYIDAYRIDDKPSWFIKEYVDFENIAYVSSPSRTEARRAAWQNWINIDLSGFKEWDKRIWDKTQSNNVR